MDLSPFYDLRARLHAGAVAGAALAAGDFRLGRALEGLGPLEQAAPVFQRLGQLTRALLAPDCPDRAGALLDALSLADAIACTQGAVAVPGTVEPLPLESRGSAVTNAPWSVLAPLLEALTTSGGGKYGFVVDTHDQRPELFRDYRVKDALVQGLGAAYAELADRCEEWLSAGDGSILPLLQKGFDPCGKKDMVRRVHVMEAVAGAAANDFYLAQLERAEKEVRAALIYALRRDEGNADKLVDLCKTEKGSCKKAAHWALAKLESPAAWAYWDKLAEKKPDQAAEYMTLSTAGKASALVAGALGRWLEPYEADPDAPMGPKEIGQLQTLLFALPGKSGPEICAVYRRMAALGSTLDGKSYQTPNGQNMAVRFQSHDFTNTRDYLPFGLTIPRILQRSILFHPAPDLVALAEELERTGEISYAIPRLTAALLTKSAGEAYELAQPLLKPVGLFQWRHVKKSRPTLRAVLGDLYWDDERRGISYFLTFSDPATGGTVKVARPLRERPDPRWYEDFTSLGADDTLDALLDRMLCPDDPALCARVGKYFYQRALFVEDNRPYLGWMRRCGWTKCDGLLEAYCKRNKTDSWHVRVFIEQMPGSLEDVSEEARRVLKLVQEKKIAVRAAWYPNLIEQALLDRQNAAPA